MTFEFFYSLQMSAWNTDYFCSYKVLNSIFENLSDTRKKTIFKGTVMGMGYKVWPMKGRSGLHLEKLLSCKLSLARCFKKKLYNHTIMQYFVLKKINTAIL